MRRGIENLFSFRNTALTHYVSATFTHHLVTKECETGLQNLVHCIWSTLCGRAQSYYLARQGHKAIVNNPMEEQCRRKVAASTHPMQNPLRMEIFQSLQRHDGVGFDMTRRQHDALVLDNHLEVGLHEIKHQADVGLLTEHIQELT